MNNTVSKSSDKDVMVSTPIKQGETIVVVEDTKLAAALISVGIRFRSPGFRREKNRHGEEKWIYMFCDRSVDGKLLTQECIDAWSKDLDFLKDNDNHPFAFTMVAVKNYQSLLDQGHNYAPYLKFSRTGGTNEPVVMVIEGSAKHKAAINRGLKQI